MSSFFQTFYGNPRHKTLVVFAAWTFLFANNTVQKRIAPVVPVDAEVAAPAEDNFDYSSLLKEMGVSEDFKFE